MRLIHYSSEPLAKVDSTPFDPKNEHHKFKPPGLWVSVDGENDWLEWCKAEEFGLERLKCATEIVLTDNHNVLILSSAEDLDKFTDNFNNPTDPCRLIVRGRNHSIYAIDWAKVHAKYQGLIIAPYIWQRRLDLMWYYGWDCASGVIWDATAIKEIRAVKPPNLSTKAA